MTIDYDGLNHVVSVRMCIYHKKDKKNSLKLSKIEKIDQNLSKSFIILTQKK